MQSGKKLLGELAFVSRTFEGEFKDTPFVLDMEGNLYIGPADQWARSEHGAIQVVLHFLAQLGLVERPVRELLRDRRLLLDAFAAFDGARDPGEGDEFRIHVYGTWDGARLVPGEDDVLPAGPCGAPVNDIKSRLYDLCRRLDPRFEDRRLTDAQRAAEARFL